MRNGAPNFSDFNNTESNIDIKNLKLAFIVSEKTGKLASFLINILQPFYKNNLLLVGKKPKNSNFVLKINTYRSGEKIAYLSHQLLNKEKEVNFLEKATLIYAEDAVEEIYNFGNLKENMLKIALSAFFGSRISSKNNPPVQLELQHQIRDKQLIEKEQKQ
jgi:hypothetical protein